MLQSPINNKSMDKKKKYPIPVVSYHYGKYRCLRFGTKKDFPDGFRPFVEELKETVPIIYRRYDPGNRVWFIRRAYFEQVQDLANKHNVFIKNIPSQPRKNLNKRK